LEREDWGGVDWIGVAQDRDKWRGLLNVVINLRVPSNAGKFLCICKIGSSSRAQMIELVSYVLWGGNFFLRFTPTHTNDKIMACNKNTHTKKEKHLSYKILIIMENRK
jgi:hypothetical protein